jgi:hypothetical protein
VAVEAAGVRKYVRDVFDHDFVGVEVDEVKVAAAAKLDAEFHASRHRQSKRPRQGRGALALLEFYL